jgi:peptidoglycan/LPS O-acetylase OafA/YrhL
MREKIATSTVFVIASLCRPGLFRLFLAVLVVVSHLSRFDVGRIAVLLFFFLSGFWIANIWDTKFNGEPIRFYLARTLRIYPLYWLVASFAVFAFPAPLSLSNFINFRRRQCGE